MHDVVERGMIEFYLRWNNIPDQYGLSFVLAGCAELAEARTAVDANETTVCTLHPRGSHCKKRGACLRVGYLPYDVYPRQGDWAVLRGSAAVYHLTYACAQEEAPCAIPGVRPFRGHRQRLDRYDQVDFADMADTLRSLGLWLVDDAKPAESQGGVGAAFGVAVGRAGEPRRRRGRGARRRRATVEGGDSELR